MKLFGLDPQDAQDRMGSLGQAVRIDKLVHDDGPERGARLIRLVSGGAFEVEVHPDRALDIGRVTYRGIPLAWASPTGMSAPGLSEPLGDGWVRTWGGGMLTTIGLDSFGPSGKDGSEEFGTHGRIGMQPATVTRAEITRDSLHLEGDLRQATAFGDTLVMNRRITLPIGGSTLEIRDTVSNPGPDPVEWMVLYHVNLGWPLLDAHTTIGIPGKAASGENEAPLTIGRPSEEWQEIKNQYVLDKNQDSVTVVNPDNGLTLQLQYSPLTLPWLNTWRLTQKRRYVMALEPSNTPSVAGRIEARKTGDLPRLEAGESQTMSLRIEVTGQ